MKQHLPQHCRSICSSDSNGSQPAVGRSGVAARMGAGLQQQPAGTTWQACALCCCQLRVAAKPLFWPALHAYTRHPHMAASSTKAAMHTHQHHAVLHRRQHQHREKFCSHFECAQERERAHASHETRDLLLLPYLTSRLANEMRMENMSRLASCTPASISSLDSPLQKGLERRGDTVRNVREK